MTTPLVCLPHGRALSAVLSTAENFGLGSTAEGEPIYRPQRHHARGRRGSAEPAKVTNNAGPNASVAARGSLGLCPAPNPYKPMKLHGIPKLECRKMRSYTYKPLIFVLAIALLPSIAMAASSSCRFLPVQGHGETGTVAANPSGHFVFFEVSPNANYKVKDEQTRQVVATGTAGWRGTRRTIFGLYGSEYKLYVDNPFGGYGYISNQ
jgi:hypothetical protein